MVQVGLHGNRRRPHLSNYDLPTEMKSIVDLFTGGSPNTISLILHELR